MEGMKIFHAKNTTKINDIKESKRPVSDDENYVVSILWGHLRKTEILISYLEFIPIKLL